MIKLIGDMYLAAALLSYGAELLKIDKTNTKRQMFEFSGDIKQVFTLEPEDTIQLRKNPSLDEIEALYISRKLFFPPSYTDSLRRIKVSIHTE